MWGLENMYIKKERKSLSDAKEQQDKWKMYQSQKMFISFDFVIPFIGFPRKKKEKENFHHFPMFG